MNRTIGGAFFKTVINDDDKMKLACACNVQGSLKNAGAHKKGRSQGRTGSS